MATGDPSDPNPCPLCGRPLVDGASVDRHHLIPRRHGGTAWAHVHRICHTKIHSVFSERELAERYFTFDRLRAHEEIARFVTWVRRMPPEYVGRHRARRRDPRAHGG
jgi:hypothetical protein